MRWGGKQVPYVEVNAAKRKTKTILIPILFILLAPSFPDQMMVSGTTRLSSSKQCLTYDPFDDRSTEIQILRSFDENKNHIGSVNFVIFL